MLLADLKSEETPRSENAVYALIGIGKEDAWSRWHRFSAAKGRRKWRRPSWTAGCEAFRNRPAMAKEHGMEIRASENAAVVKWAAGRPEPRSRSLSSGCFRISQDNSVGNQRRKCQRAQNGRQDHYALISPLSRSYCTARTVVTTAAGMDAGEHRLDAPLLSNPSNAPAAGQPREPQQAEAVRTLRSGPGDLAAKYGLPRSASPAEPA